MDYGERIAKAEAVVESHKEQLSRIEQELVRQREHTDQRFAEVRASIDALREHTDQRFAEARASLDSLRAHTDQRFAELRSSMEASLEVIRAELAQSMRWQIRITITLFLAVAGMFMAFLGVLAKLGGLL